MTRKLKAAHEVLTDCETARARLDDELDDVSWRLLWVAAVVLLRSVGHVLAKVDAAGDSAVRRAADAAFRSWLSASPERHIFRDFIDEDRNLIIKQYKHRMSSGPVMLAAITPVESDKAEAAGACLADENLFRPMLSGKYEGEDGRDLLDEAIAWWKRELDEIEMAARAG